MLRNTFVVVSFLQMFPAEKLNLYNKSTSLTILFREFSEMSKLFLEHLWTITSTYDFVKSAGHFEIFVVRHTKSFPAGNYMFKVNNRNGRSTYEICSKLAIKTPQRRRYYLEIEIGATSFRNPVLLESQQNFILK